MDKREKGSYGTKEIQEGNLERWKNEYNEDYNINFTIPEFTCVCPRSGFPDFGTFYIRYKPDKWLVELKSLKLYINKFRDIPISHENSTNKIFDNLWNLLEPKYMKVIGDFARRGNIHTVVEVERLKENG